MDNTTYTELNLTPTGSDETYTQLRMTRNEVRPKNERQRSLRADIDQTSTKEAPSNTKVNTAMLIIIIMILLLLTLTSIALSVATFSRLTSELSSVQSQLASQIENTKSYEHNLTQLIQTQNNISQTLAQLDDRVNDFIYAEVNPQIQSQCGAGLWWRVAYLDMTEPLQQCPSAWREYNTSRVRACGRPVNSTGSCAAVFYFPNRQYSRVCGRIIGYQFDSPDAFRQLGSNGGDLDGITVSYGAQQGYIWSFVTGLTEGSPSGNEKNCPCSTVPGTRPPTHIGDKYFCESGNPNNTFVRGRLYSSDRLWDGQQCEGSCCEGAQTPPWFSVQLPAPTTYTDMIEVSICCDQGTMDEDTPVELMEIYVQ
jgi:dynein heavy chain